MIDQIRSLAIFAKVAEAGSFRGAARTIGLSPSVVSQQVAHLEKRLGAALIYRTTRGFSLTPDGETLLQSAQAAVQAAEEGLAQFSGTSSEPVGVLRVSVPAILDSGPFIKDIAEFAELYPGIALRVTFSDTPSDLIRDGFDLAIRMGWLSDSTLKARKIADVQRRFVASPDYVAKYKTPRSPADLAQWRIIRFESIASDLEFVHATKGKVKAQGAAQLTVNSGNAMHNLAIAGAGAASLLEFVVRSDLENGRLVEVLPSWRLSSPGIYAVSPPNAPRHSLSRKFTAFLEERLNTL